MINVRTTHIFSEGWNAVPSLCSSDSKFNFWLLTMLEGPTKFTRTLSSNRIMGVPALSQRFKIIRHSPTLFVVNRWILEQKASLLLEERALSHHNLSKTRECLLFSSYKSEFHSSIGAEQNTFIIVLLFPENRSHWMTPPTAQYRGENLTGKK